MVEEREEKRACGLGPRQKKKKCRVLYFKRVARGLFKRGRKKGWSVTSASWQPVTVPCVFYFSFVVSHSYLLLLIKCATLAHTEDE